MLRSLRHPDYRLLLAGQLLGSSAQWMEQVARGWLIYEMTGSALLLGAVMATRAMPLLIFGLAGGVLADRYDRKRQVVLAQNANLVLNLVLAALIFSGRLEVWQVFVTAFLAGSVMAIQQPARQSMIPSVVPREDLLNAVALNSGVVNMTRTVGPAIAGVVVAVVGVGWSYVIQGAMFLFASQWTSRMHLSREPEPSGSRGTPWGSFTEGLRYIRSNNTVLALLVLALVPIILAQPYSALVPVFAQEVYQMGAIGQGILLAVPGVGSVVGAALIARLGEGSPNRVFHLIGGITAFGLALVGFAFSPSFPIALAFLFIVGFAGTTYRAVNQTALHLATEDAYRGRVMSMYLLDKGLAPLGSLGAGILATALGAPDAVAIMGLLTALFAIALFLWVAPVRELAGLRFDQPVGATSLPAAQASAEDDPL